MSSDFWLACLFIDVHTLDIMPRKFFSSTISHLCKVIRRRLWGGDELVDGGSYDRPDCTQHQLERQHQNPIVVWEPLFKVLLS